MNYIQELADKIKSEVPSALLPDEPNLDTLFAIYAVLLLAKGNETTLEDVHNCWSAWKSQKDASHNSIKPFVELSNKIQEQDRPFVEAIHAVARSLY